MSALDELLLKKYRESVVDASAQADGVHIENDAVEPGESVTASQPVDVETAGGQQEIAEPSEETLESPEETLVASEETLESPEEALESPEETLEASEETLEASEETLEASEETLEASEETLDAIEPVAEPSDADELCVAEAATVPEDSETNDHPSEVEPEENQVQFKPDWEVDRFLWPGICGEVEARVEQKLTEAIGYIEEQCSQRRMNVVAVTSSRPGAGATTMTLCLAREAARQGLRVALVDLNHSNPSVMDSLGVAFEEGTECLQKADITPEGICVRAIEDNISFFPTVEAIDLDYCVGEGVKELIAVVSRHHDLVLIDTSNEVAELISERQAFGQHGTIVVTDPSTSREVVPVAQQPDQTLGIIENFAA